MKLYGPQGEIMSPEQEASSIRVHFEDILQGATMWQMHIPETAIEVFNCEEILSELMRIPFHKAAPKHLAPGALWRAAAPVLAPRIQGLLQCMWSRQIYVPQTWKDGWVALAQKPNKLGRCLHNFRPLCLQDPIGKSVLKLVAARIKPQIQLYASSCPQHAYLPSRSVEGALLAVFDRCREIRAIAQAARRDIFAKRMGTKAEPCAGGLVLSLDMSMAFDIVPRQHIQAALLEAGVAETDVALIMEWLRGSTYHIKHCTHDIRVKTEKGVRQGCVLSPLLWTCFTCFVLKRLGGDTQLSDLQVYADDVLMSRIFRTKDQMIAALKAIPQLMQHLQSYGLKINVQKTAVLIRLAHRDGRTLLRQHLCKNKHGVYLKTIGPTTVFIPVKQQHNYLGCILSLYDFETLTVKYRLEMGKNQFTRLRSVLMSQRCLPLDKRAYMWQVCVWTALSYGLTCTGCASMHMQLISGIVAKQLRSIARLPRHITHATNSEVHARVGVPMPADLLQQASQNLWHRLLHAQATLPETDVMRWPSVHRQAKWSGRLIEDARHFATKLVRVLDSDGECGVYFANESSMRKHRSRKHPEVLPEKVPDPEIRRELHCIDGMPTCRGCGKQFHHMHTLLKHIRNKRCAGGNVLVESAGNEPLPLCQRHELLQQWIVGGTNALLESLKSDASLKKEMLEHCCLCRQWVADRRHIKLHIRQSHGVQCQEIHDKAVAGCQQLTGAITCFCPFCDVPSLTNRQRHAVGCTVLYQAALCCRSYGQSAGGGGRLTLRGIAASGEQSTGSGQERPQCGHGGGPATPEVAEAQGQGSRKQGPKQASLLAFMAGRGQPGGKPSTSNVDPALPATGGQHQHDADGSGIPDAIQNERRGNAAPDLQRHSRQVEGAPCSRDHGGAAKGGTLQMFGFGAPKPGKANDGDQVGGPGKAGLGDQKGEHGALLAFPDVQSGEGARRSGARHGSAAALGSSGCVGEDHQQHGWADHTTLSCDKTVGGKLFRRHASLHVGSLDQGSGTATGASGNGQTGQLHSVVSHRSQDEARHSENGRHWR